MNVNLYCKKYNVNTIIVNIYYIINNIYYVINIMKEGNDNLPNNFKQHSCMITIKSDYRFRTY